METLRILDLTKTLQCRIASLAAEETSQEPVAGLSV